MTDDLVELFEFDMAFLENDHGHAATNVYTNQVWYDLVADGHGRSNRTSGARMDVRHQPDSLAGSKFLVTEFLYLCDAGFIYDIGVDDSMVMLAVDLYHVFTHFLDIGLCMALQVGFEPTEVFRPLRFSRPPPSSTRPL